MNTISSPYKRKTVNSSPTSPKGSGDASCCIQRPSRKESASLPHVRDCVISEEARMNWREKHKGASKNNEKNEEVMKSMTSHSLGPGPGGKEWSELRTIERGTLKLLLRAFISMNELEGTFDEQEFLQRFEQLNEEIQLFCIETKTQLELASTRNDEVIFIEYGGVKKSCENEEIAIGEKTCFIIDCWDEHSSFHTLENTRLWVLERFLIAQFMQLSSSMMLDFLKPILNSIPFFSPLTATQKEEICLNLKPFRRECLEIPGIVLWKGRELL